MLDNRYMTVISGDGREEVVHLQIRPAWRYYWRWFAAILAATILTAGTEISTEGIIFSLCIFAVVAVMRFRMLFTVTSKRAIMRIGLIARNTREVEIRHTREMTVRQGIIERLLGYGDIEISTAASTGAEVIFTGISYPHDLKEAIRHVRNGM